jgi:hypothetical protein
MAKVEAVLATRESPSAPPQYVDPLALASLIVGIVDLAWPIYTDLKKRTARPSAEVVARTVRGHPTAPGPGRRAGPHRRHRCHRDDPRRSRSRAFGELTRLRGVRAKARNRQARCAGGSGSAMIRRRVVQTSPTPTTKPGAFVRQLSGPSNAYVGLPGNEMA